MKRQYFKNFYIAFMLWLIGMIGFYVGNLKPNWEISLPLFWIGFLSFSILGLFLIYRAYRATNKYIKPTDNPNAEMILGVSLIAGFGVLGLIGLITETLQLAAMIIGPFYAIWNLYRYFSFTTPDKT